MGPSIYKMLPNFDDILKEKNLFEQFKDGSAMQSISDKMEDDYFEKTESSQIDEEFKQKEMQHF